MALIKLKSRLVLILSDCTFPCEKKNLLFHASVVFTSFFELQLKRIWLLDICRHLLSIRGEDAFNVSVPFGAQTIQQKGSFAKPSFLTRVTILRLQLWQIAWDEIWVVRHIGQWCSFTLGAVLVFFYFWAFVIYINQEGFLGSLFRGFWFILVYLILIKKHTFT